MLDTLPQRVVDAFRGQFATRGHYACELIGGNKLDKEPPVLRVIEQ